LIIFIVLINFIIYNQKFCEVVKIILLSNNFEISLVAITLV